MLNRSIWLSLSLLGSVALTGAEPAPAPAPVVAAPAPAAAVPAAPKKEAAPVFKGEVTADKLNCRLAPSLDAAVGVVVRRGTVVEMTACCGNFVEIKAPADTKVYLSAVYVSGGKTIRELNLRTRPEPGAPVFMKLPAGSAVTKIADLPNGWARIAPPEALRLYAARFYLKGEFPPAKVKDPAPVKAEEKKAAPVPVKAEEKKAAPAPVKAEEKKAAPVPVKAEEKKAAPAPVKAEEKKVASVPVKKQVEKALLDAAKVAELKLGLKTQLGVDLSKGSRFESTGILMPLSSETAFVHYSLWNTSNELVAYVSVSDPAVVKPLVGRPVFCRGMLHAVPGWKTKVLEVESITAK